MGSFVGFECRFSRCEDVSIGVGHGKAAAPFQALYRCHYCRTIGSAWIHEVKIPRCSNRYDDAITILPEDPWRTNRPKCGQPAVIAPKEGNWD